MLRELKLAELDPTDQPSLSFYFKQILKIEVKEKILLTMFDTTLLTPLNVIKFFLTALWILVIF